MLYICYHRICEPLGEATVVPYLKCLSQLGVDLDLISFEDKAYMHHYESRKKSLAEYRIIWCPLTYRNKVRFISGILNIFTGIYASYKILRDKDIKIVYAKGTVAGIISSVLKFKFSNIKVVFDNDGLWAQERKDACIWGKISLFYNIAFWIEKYIYNKIDYLVVLTSLAKEYIKNKMDFDKPVFVRPICADDYFFANQDKRIDEKLSFLKGKKVIIYSGAVGTWYMLDQMLDFFKVLQEKDPNAFFLFLTYPDNLKKVKDVFLNKGIHKSSFCVDFCPHSEIYKYYAAASAGLYFIRPFISKQASSPTKLAEMLASGLFVVTNKGIGDADVLLKENDAGVLCENFSYSDYSLCADILLKKINDPNIFNQCRNTAMKYLSMEKTKAVYSDLINKIRSDADIG